MMRHALAALALAGVSVVADAQGPAPTGRCSLDLDQLPNSHLNLVQLPSGKYNQYIGGGVVARCVKQKIVLRADSVEQYGDEGRSFFIGHVDYSEPRLKLKSDFLNYFQKDERLLAVSNVDATLPSGSRLKGTSLEYFKAIPKVRPQQHAVAIGRPTITVIEKDAQGKAQDPVSITGNNIWLEGDSVVSSQGEVLVVRPELTATGDSLYLDGGKGLLRVMRKPRIVGTKGRPFTLVGETIDLLSKRKKLERVLSKSAAEAISDDLHLTSDTIDLRVLDDQLQRATAWGKSRAHAISPTRTIVSDSIDVLMPGQRIREMHAVRQAAAEGLPDTSKVRTTERDRLTGDTIVAVFDSIPARDTVTKARIKQLQSVGHATSLQHLAAQDSACHLPAFNYIRGRLITVTFDSAKVDKVVVTDPDQSAGVYAEPPATCGKENADSTGTTKRPAGNAPPAPGGQRPPNAPPPSATPVKKP